MARLRQRMAAEEGFTLIELLVVIVIIGILLAIAVPSYLGFRDRANQRAASADVRAAIPSAEAYFADNGTYGNKSVATVFTTTYLKAQYDQGLKIDAAKILDSGASYCLSGHAGDRWSHVVRGSGTTATTAATGFGGNVHEDGAATTSTCP